MQEYSRALWTQGQARYDSQRSYLPILKLFKVV
jgi:hypothetical protein